MIGRPALLPLDATLIEGYPQPQKRFLFCTFEYVEEGTTNENDPAPHTPPPESSETIREDAENNY